MLDLEGLDSNPGSSTEQPSLCGQITCLLRICLVLCKVEYLSQDCSERYMK